MKTTLDRSIPPLAKDVEDFPMPAVQTVTLPNGLQVYYTPIVTQPLIYLVIDLPAGQWFEQVGAAASMAGRGLTFGTGQHPMQEIHDQLDQLGIGWQISPNRDTVQITIRCLVQHFAKAANLLAHLLAEAKYPKETYQKERQRLMEMLAIREGENNFIAQHTFMKTLFGQNHPYGRVANTKSIGSCDRNDAFAHYQKHIYQQPFNLLLAGQVDAEVLSVLAESLGQLPIDSSRKATTAPQLPKPGQQKLIYQAREDALQTSILVGRRIFPYNHPDHISFKVCQTILAGFFGSRLMANIREKNGFSYGISGNYHFFDHDSLYMVSTSVIKDKREEARLEIVKELETLCLHGVSSEELTLVGSYLAGQHLRGFGTPWQALGNMRICLRHHLPFHSFDRYISQLKAVTAEEVKTVANKYLSPDDLYFVMVG